MTPPLVSRRASAPGRAARRAASAVAALLTLGPARAALGASADTRLITLLPGITRMRSGNRSTARTIAARASRLRRLRR